MSSSALFSLECAAAAAPWRLPPLQSSRTSSNSANSTVSAGDRAIFAATKCNFIGSRRVYSRRRICFISPSSADFRTNMQCGIGAITPNRLNGRSARLRSLGPSGSFLRSSGFRERRPGKLIFRVRAENERGDGTSGDGDESTSQGNGNEGKQEEAEAAGGGGGGGGGGLLAVCNRVANSVKRFAKEFAQELRNETGFDSEVALLRLGAEYYALRETIEEGLAAAQDEVQSKVTVVREEVTGAVKDVRFRYWPQFVNWNRIELWKDRTRWDWQRAGALVMYLLVVGSFLRGAHMIVTKPRPGKKALEQTADAFLESVIPEPTPANIRKFKKALWREKMPAGLNVKKFKLGDDGDYEQDYSFPGDLPEERDSDPNFDADRAIDESDLFTPEEKEQLKRDILEAKSTANLEPIDEDERVRARVDITELIDEMDNISPEEKEQWKKEIAEERARQAKEMSERASGQEEDTSLPGVTPITTWQERLAEWHKVFDRETLKETVDAASSRYEVEVESPELLAQIVKQTKEDAPKSMRAFWVARKWWKHRPKLPYTYFLAKVLNHEVRAAVYTEDMTKLYVTMKEGFPTDYVVDIPVDPALYPMLESSGVEMDVLHRTFFYYYVRILLVLLPSVLLIWLIRRVQYKAKEKASEKMYDLLSMNRQHLILPEDAADKARSQYKDVVVGGDVWQVIDEIMTYMRNPMKYHSRRVKLPRGILISGPPGTGKTLLARAIARESGLPFVFASGAEFVASGTNTGTDKIFDIFFTARANAPSFIFIDEIDALAGKGVKEDAERRATFEQLLSELDAEPEDTDVDRFAARQAVILICATNRPDELDEDLMRPGRIDREIHIGLPAEEERLGIFNVHSQGKPLGADVDFSKLVFRTIGYSGADIRNLINEAGIMAVREGHDQITQHDFIKVLDKQLFEGMGVVLMDEEQKEAEQKIPEENKKLLAVHEAGHILLAHLFPSFDWHAFSHLLPGGSDTALSVFYPRQEMLQLGHTTVGYVMMQMVVAHGGRCAERLVFGDISDGGQDDLARISSLARELTISPANTQLGLFPMKWRATMDPPKLPGEVALIPNEWDKQGTYIVNMSVELSETFTREVTKYADETEEIAMTALSQNRHILEKLADLLLAKTKLTGYEAEELIRSMNPVLLPDYMDNPMPDFESFEEKVVPPNMRGRYEELNIYAAPLHQG
ncbi:unnamed protein product [Calypogeia fissa]